MKYRIQKTIRFEASHVLMGLPEGHKCTRLHGHSYKVEVIIMSLELNEAGFVIDFGDISTVIRDTFDHRHLNDLMKKSPTAENLAALIMEMLNSIIFEHQDEKVVAVERVRVWETETSWAEVTI